MKQLLFFSILLTHSILSFAGEFRFEEESFESIREKSLSYDNEVISIAGIEMTRADLASYSVIDSIDSSYNSHDTENNILNNNYVRASIDVSLAAVIIHTTLQAEDDKKKHVLAGAIVGAAATKICEYFLKQDNNRLVCALTGAGAALLAGVAKEVYDTGGRGSVEAMDAVYTFVPGALVSFKFQL